MLDLLKQVGRVGWATAVKFVDKEYKGFVLCAFVFVQVVDNFLQVSLEVCDSFLIRLILLDSLFCERFCEICEPRLFQLS